MSAYEWEREEARDAADDEDGRRVAGRWINAIDLPDMADIAREETELAREAARRRAEVWE